MVIFIISAVLGYVLAQLLRSHGWKRRDEIIISIVIFLLIIGLVLAGIGALPLQNKISTTLARLALEPDASQWSLGLLAGFLCANLNHWITPGSAAIKTAGEANLYKWRLIIFGGAIFILGGLALLAPYSSRLMERVTSLQAPYLKLQFADPSAERQLGLGTERDRYSTDLLVGFPSGGRTIQYDCGYEALKNGDGIASFRGTKRYGVIEKAVAFRNRLNPYIMRLIRAQQLVKAQQLGHDVETIRARTASLTGKLTRLLSHPLLAFSSDTLDITRGTDPTLVKDFEINYQALLSDIDSQERALEKQQIAGGPPPPANAGDPFWCGARDDTTVDADQFRRVILSTRFVVGPTEQLLAFQGDIEGAIRVLRLAKAQPDLARDINVNYDLADVLYIGGRDFAEIIDLLVITRDGIQAQNRDVEDYVKKASPSAEDNDIVNNLRQRYKRADLIVTEDLAYISAARGLEDPDSGVDWEMIGRWAKNGYTSRNVQGVFNFGCIDDFKDVKAIDTYAYVTLATSNSRGPETGAKRQSALGRR